MFENILIPISSEFYPKHVLNFSVFLATKFKSKINLVYIIEEKTLKQTDKLSNGFRTFYDKNDTKKDIIGKQKQTADNIIFDYAKFIYDNQKISFSKKMVKGEFSKIINNETKEKKYDLVLMGFQKGSTLNYRLFEKINVPVWVKMVGDTGSILAVCSNLAPNKNVPDFSVKLSKSLGWDLNMIYVVDTEDNVEVNCEGVRSSKKPERELVFSAQKFIDGMENKNVSMKLIKGNLLRETLNAAGKYNSNLIIIGREHKEKGLFGFPFKNFKKKMVEKGKYSLIFLN
jgi:hypothetical protein